MKITGLDHVQLAMPPGGEQAADSFYAGVLGLRPVAKPAALSARGGCWFDGSGVQLHLGIEPEFAPARKAHPALLVDDIDECAAALGESGAFVIRDDAVEGRRRLYTEDPFGNRIEIIQAGDGFMERPPPKA